MTSLPLPDEAGGLSLQLAQVLRFAGAPLRRRLVVGLGVDEAALVLVLVFVIVIFIGATFRSRRTGFTSWSLGVFELFPMQRVLPVAVGAVRTLGFIRVLV